MIPKEYIVYAVPRDRDLLICGYFRNHTNLQIPRDVINVLDTQCKLSYHEFNATHGFYTVSIRCNGCITGSSKRDDYEINAYGIEKSSTRSNEFEGELRIQNMDRFLCNLQKLPMQYEIEEWEYDGSRNWNFKNCYRSDILRTA
eukprot:CAMPEP_0197050274 /NCGR_PEP_ID=MMETSP1384-20130603/25204_1 /TAXON_ID=29189 /ORGANISM="Ammonia sp." /LENGTH=143 /DNA_ID=CAMNT_0042482651 /DNA_START=169 /DNA_END=597 /DNA_ORIENTATION=+